MKILQVSNCLSPHQLPLARAFVLELGEEHFRYAATDRLTPERVRLGWSPSEVGSWALLAGESGAGQEQFARWWDEADVVLCGQKLLPMFARRLQDHKLIFYMSERWWKPPLGMARMLYPPYMMEAMRFRRLAASPYLHFLPMGGYAARDMNHLAKFHQRMWQWGYCTEMPDPLPGCSRNGASYRILWAGRMLPWKRVDILLRAFVEVAGLDRSAELVLIGEGPCRQSLESLVRKLGIGAAVVFRPPVPLNEVRAAMRSADVYVLPSNGYEGWGAVVNEAMSEGCAVIASESAGAAKTIIRDGHNGFLFCSGDWRYLGQLLCWLNRDRALAERIGASGQRTIAEMWSPKAVAMRFLSVCDSLLSQRSIPSYDEGPMSPAWESQ